MTVQPLTPERFSARPIDGFADLSTARSEFGRWLQSIGIGDETVDDLLVVVSELGANAVRESREDGPPPTIAAAYAVGSIELDVANRVDAAKPDALRDWDLEDPLRTGGRGLMIVSALMDEVDVDVEGRWLHVRCTIAVDGDQDDSTVT